MIFLYSSSEENVSGS